MNTRFFSWVARLGLVATITLIGFASHAQTNGPTNGIGRSGEQGLSSPKANATVVLNSKRAGGIISKADVLCGSISKLDTEKGWVRISAESSDKNKVEGWLHQVYGDKLNLVCGEGAIREKPELSMVRSKPITQAKRKPESLQLSEAPSKSDTSVKRRPNKAVSADNKNPWLLSRALSDLLQRHGLIEAAQMDLEGASERQKEAWGAWFPSLVVGSHWAYEDNNKAEAAGDTNMYARGLDFTATQLLWDFGGGNANIRIAELNKKIAADTLEVTRQDLLLRAIVAYLNLKRAGDLYGYALKSEKNIRKQTELENALVRRGAGLSSDVMQAKQQFAAASALRVQARGAMKVARNNFRAVFRGEPPAFSKIRNVRVPVKSLPANLKEAIEIALRENPKIIVANTSSDVTREGVKVARGSLMPRFEAVGTAKHKDNQGGTAGIAEEYSGKFQLTWPINLGLTGFNTISAANKTATATALRVSEQLHLIEEQVRNTWDSLYTARTTAAFLRNQANIAAEFLEVARKERKMGNRSLLEVLAGETGLITANSAARSAETDIRLFAFTLLNSIGRLTLDVLEN